MTVAMILVLLASLASSSEAAQDQGPIPAGTASIAGRVVDREWQRPLEGVLVQLASPDARRAMTAMTDGNGQYLFEAIAAGPYRLKAMLDGFVTQYDGRASAASPSDETVRVEVHETRRLVDLSLQRGGSIGGRVTDAQGRPLKDATVDAMFIAEPGYRGGGLDRIPRSNARGEYTAENLSPGTYYIAVQWTDPDVLDANARPDRTVVFHPGVSRTADAAAVRLAAGETVRNVDHVRVGRSPVASVSIQPGAELHEVTVVLGRR